MEPNKISLNNLEDYLKMKSIDNMLYIQKGGPRGGQKLQGILLLNFKILSNILYTKSIKIIHLQLRS